MKKSIPEIGKRTKQISLALGVLLILSGVVYLLKYKQKKSLPKSKAPFPIAQNTTDPFRCISSNYPLSYGTCHPDVKILQRHLKSLDADLGGSGVDGKFGALTLRAAKAKLGKSSFDRAAITEIRNKIQA